MEPLTQSPHTPAIETDSANTYLPTLRPVRPVREQIPKWPEPDIRKEAPRFVAPGKKLRLLLVITRLTVGGDTNVLLDIARRFRNHPAIEAEIAAGPVPASEIDLTHLTYESGIPTSIISTLGNRPDPLLMVRAILELRRVIRDRRFDIVHTHSSVAGVIGRIAAATSRVPVIIHHVHGWGLQEHMSVAMKCTYLGLERMCARFTDRLIAVSWPTLQNGLAHSIGSKDKYSLIYNGIDLQRFGQQMAMQNMRRELGLEPQSKLVGMIGRLDRQKNPADLIRAAALVVKQFPGVQFLIVGEGALRSECEQLMNEFHLEKHCKLIGFRNDVERLLPLLTMVASTSLWEGLPVVFQEAMCAGKPIVANNVDGVSDVVQNDQTGYLVTPHDPQDMADAILRLLKDEELCRRFGARARQSSARFSLQRMLDQIESLYLQLATSHGIGDFREIMPEAVPSRRAASA